LCKKCPNQIPQNASGTPERDINWKDCVHKGSSNHPTQSRQIQRYLIRRTYTPILSCFAFHTHLLRLRWRSTTSRWQTHEDLEVVVDHPLQTSKSTNHNNSYRQAIPQTAETNITIDS